MISFVIAVLVLFAIGLFSNLHTMTRPTTIAVERKNLSRSIILQIVVIAWAIWILARKLA